MTGLVLDSASAIPADAAKAFTGVVRYLSDFPAKNLSLPELRAYQDAHVPVALVWENDTTDWQGGADAGAAYGGRAKLLADALGWPQTRPVRAAFDADVPSTEYPTCVRYLAAFQAALGRPAGAYAPWPLLRALAADGFGFSWGLGSSSFNTGPRPSGLTLQQRPGVPGFAGPWQADVGGVTCDLNDVLANDWGQWPAAAPAGTSVSTTWVAMARTPDATGYWLLGRTGAVRAFGSAVHEGDLVGRRLNGAPVAIEACASGGYWVACADGGIFAFGGAPFYGSAASERLNAPIVAMRATDGGYYLLGADGGVFAFGEARFFGSAA